MQNKNIRKSLVVSILSMIVCLAMLISSTFAWFTDSVVSGTNKIVAGNLDVELIHSNAKVTDEKVGTDTKLFVDKVDGNPIKWEPGVMAYENFTVKNMGSLALKYQLKVNVSKFNTDNGHSLKEVLKVAILKDQHFSGDRTKVTELTNTSTTIDKFNEEGFLLADDAGKEGKKYAMVIYWAPTDHDNDYNLNNNNKTADDGSDHLFIDLGVTLSATQYTYENDSFNEKYDEGAVIPALTQEAFNEALETSEPGDKIALSSGEYALEPKFTIPEGVSISGDGTTKLHVDGNKENSDNSQTSNPALNINSDNVTISNVEIVGTNVGNNEYDSLVRISGNNVTLDNVTINAKTDASPIVIANTKSPDNVVTIKECTVNDAFKAIHIVDGTVGTVKIEGCTIDSLYPFNVNTNSVLTMEVSDSVLNGWTSYGSSVTKSTFTNCKFGQETTYYNSYGYLVAYADTDLINCTFDEGFYAETKNGYEKTMKFVDCNMNGTPITAENVKEKFHAEDDSDSIDQARGWTVIVNDEKVETLPLLTS